MASTNSQILAELPLGDYPAIEAWYRRLEALPAWADPFVGLDAPLLPGAPLAAERKGLA